MTRPCRSRWIMSSDQRKRISNRLKSWWRHQIKTFSALLAPCAGNSQVTGKFPSQRPVTQSFDVSLFCAWINGCVTIMRLVIWDTIAPIYDVTVMATVMRNTWLSWVNPALPGASHPLGTRASAGMKMSFVYDREMDWKGTVSRNECIPPLHWACTWPAEIVPLMVRLWMVLSERQER